MSRKAWPYSLPDVGRVSRYFVEANLVVFSKVGADKSNTNHDILSPVQSGSFMGRVLWHLGPIRSRPQAGAMAPGPERCHVCLGDRVAQYIIQK